MMNVIPFISIIFATLPAIVLPLNSHDCGVANFERRRGNRIVGGTNVYGWKYPWYGVLIHAETGRPNCGANLISTKHLLTAAHCYDDYQSSVNDDFPIEAIYNVHLSTTNWCLPNRRRQIFQIRTVHIHPKYSDLVQSDVSADLALLVLRKEARDFRPICLPTQGEHSERGHVLGFGLTQYKFNAGVCVLREIFVEIFSAKQCRRNDNPSFYNSRDTICAGITAGGVDACQGDSGGLLQIKTEERKYFIIGIVSFGDACALQNRPGIYTNVTYHLRWILNICKP